MKLTTPVAFLVFNRPKITARVFEAIRQAQPSQLLIIADGARLNQIKESEKCQQVQDICDRIDWECEVKRNYADVDLGCKKRVSTGLDWVSTEVEEAIILEDECLTHPTFFPVLPRTHTKIPLLDDFAPIRQCWHNSQPLLAKVDRSNT
jgi:hypothetical protein